MISSTCDMGMATCMDENQVPWACTLHLTVLSRLQIASCSVTCAIASSETSSVQKKLILWMQRPPPHSSPASATRQSKPPKVTPKSHPLSTLRMVTIKSWSIKTKKLRSKELSLTPQHNPESKLQKYKHFEPSKSTHRRHPPPQRSCSAHIPITPTHTVTICLQARRINFCSCPVQTLLRTKYQWPLEETRTKLKLLLRADKPLSRFI